MMMLMDGYTDSSYGDAFADVYDEWYGDVSHVSHIDAIGDVGATVAALTRLTPEGADVLELGVGTGRLAIPLANALARHGSVVHGLDTSAAMLQRLALNDPHVTVVAHVGDMVTAMPPGPFGTVFVAYNTLFALTSPDRQQDCFAAVAARLDAGGVFVVEAFVPDEAATEPAPSDGAVMLRSMNVDRVVLSVSRNDRAAQAMHGQYIDITEAGGVRLRPWSIRYTTPDQLDTMATDAGFTLVQRWSSFAETPFDADSTRHVSVYRTSP